MTTVYLLSMTGQKHRLRLGGQYKIGRDSFCQLPLKDESCSRVHAELILDPDGAGAVLRDLDSRNGTWVNERRVKNQVILSDLDRLRFGTTTLIFRMLNKKPLSSLGENEAPVKETLTIPASEALLEAIESSRKRADIAGQLESIALVDLLQLLHQNQRTGQLKLTIEDHDAHIDIDQGSIRSASYRGVQGMPALFALVLKRKGLFYFKQVDLGVLERPIQHSTPQILFELCRVLDEVDQQNM